MLHAQLLVVDDELAIGKMLTTVLSKEGFEHVDVATSAEDALNACQIKTYDLILLDVMLPGKSGIEICPLLRLHTNAPILFLTAKHTDLDKLSGFAVGADDYITKPFHPLEVVARIKAHLRRYLQSTEHEPVPIIPATIYDFGHFQLDEQAGEVRVANKVVDFPAQVYQFQRMVDNVIANAILHNPVGTPIEICLVACETDGLDVEGFSLTIRDCGTGMEPEVTQQLFERYYRGTNTEGLTQGTGLGMAIAKELALAHGGEIQVASELGQGTTIQFTFHKEKSLFPSDHLKSLSTHSK
ncbi:response regulator [Brevibacillus laterosporus]|nr:response regulator [Brevibacillus laterosporus]